MTNKQVGNWIVGTFIFYILMYFFEAGDTIVGLGVIAFVVFTLIGAYRLINGK